MPRAILPVLVLAFAATAFCQDRLQTMPRYDRYERLRREIAGSVTRADVNPRWAEDSQSLTYSKNGKRVKLDIKTLKESEANDSGTTSPSGRGGQRRAPYRGRQFDTAFSADNTMKAVCRDRNVFISKADGTGEVQVTTDGSVPNRIKNGVASWVYGEELDQLEAMWWSPDGKKLAFFRFDESKVPDYYLQMNQVDIQDKLDTEAYPKAGAPNPSVQVWIYDLASKQTTKADVTFADPALAEYVYDVRWSNDGKDLWFNRTNRKQSILEWIVCNPDSGKCHVLLREENPGGWRNNHWNVTWLEGNRQFLLVSERSGYYNIYLYNADGKLVRPITQHPFEASQVLKATPNSVWYMARDGDTPYRMQLHRIGLDGKGDKRLTDPKLNHRIYLADDTKHFVDVAETLDTAPASVLRDDAGKEIRVLANTDLTKFEQLGLKRTEQFTFTAADGKTKCYGYLQKPSDFDPNKKYPLVIDVYGGPESGMIVESFRTPNPITELGFITAWIDGRGTSGRGREFRQSVYQKLGIVEIDDQAAGARELAKRPYIDPAKIGIYGTSYGGYASVMCLLRYPDVFAAASASSPVTDWRNYDSIYTERFMNTPQENPDGYANGSAMKYAKDLKGALLLFWGTSDNNVHPSNSLQLIKELSARGKRLEIMVGPDMGHSGVNSTRMWEFFVEHLILGPQRDPLAVAWGKREYRRRKIEVPNVRIRVDVAS